MKEEGKVENFYKTMFFCLVLVLFAFGHWCFMQGRASVTGQGAGTSASNSIAGADSTAAATGNLVTTAADKIKAAENSVQRVSESVGGVQQRLGESTSRAVKINDGLGECEQLARECLDLNNKLKATITGGSADASRGAESSQTKGKIK